MKLRPYARLMRLSLKNPMVGINISLSKEGFIFITELLLVQLCLAIVVDEKEEG